MVRIAISKCKGAPPRQVDIHVDPVVECSLLLLKKGWEQTGRERGEGREAKARDRDVCCPEIS